MPRKKETLIQGSYTFLPTNLQHRNFWDNIHDLILQ